MDILIDFLKAVLDLYPKLRPIIESEIRDWAGERGHDGDALIEQIRPDKFGDIDETIGDVIDKLNLPEE